MLERIEYIEKNGTAVIYRCYGDGSVVELPDTLRGLPVTELADHCFAREASVRYKKFQIRSIARAEWENRSRESEDIALSRNRKYDFDRKYARQQEERPDPELPPLCGEEIQEIVLPNCLEGTGDYVFYGCRNLTTVHFPASMKRLGGGAFVSCSRVHSLFFTVADAAETPYCMKDVLSELWFELEVTLKNEQDQVLVQLTFPEYYEEAVENTPARNIELSFHGMGYRYRQCFKSRQLDYPQYDAQFHLTVSQEYLPTVLRLVFNRLSTPVELTEAHRKDYIEWLQKEHAAVSRWIFAEERMEELQLLGRMEYFTQESLEQFLAAASAKEQAEAVSYLMEYRRTHFVQTKKRKYTF